MSQPGEQKKYAFMSEVVDLRAMYPPPSIEEYGTVGALAQRNADVDTLAAAVRALREALVYANGPYLALLMDAESRKWIAPRIWETMEKSAARSVELLDRVTDGEQP